METDLLGEKTMPEKKKQKKQKPNSSACTEYTSSFHIQNLAMKPTGTHNFAQEVCATNHLQHKAKKEWFWRCPNSALLQTPVVVSSVCVAFAGITSARFKKENLPLTYTIHIEKKKIIKLNTIPLLRIKSFNYPCTNPQ